MEDKDALLQLKKRARRHLVGAVVLAGSAAFVLNMAMDHQPRPETEEVEIRIPGQDEKPFAPRFTVPPVPETPVTTTTLAPIAKPVAPAAKPPAEPAAKPAEKPVEKPVLKPTEKPPAAPAKTPEKPLEKPVEKPAEKTAQSDAARAAAILAGKSPETVSAAAAQHVILIGAFTDPANVRNLQTKLGQLGIKVYTEPLASPQGKKTRVRAGPFDSREAGEKALEKMKRIGVNGVLTTKQ